jgi:isocitrate/isopropylmalate dehydrogenase
VGAVLFLVAYQKIGKIGKNILFKKSENRDIILFGATKNRVVEQVVYAKGLRLRLREVLQSVV